MMTVELTAEEAQKVRDCLAQIVVSGPTDALREHLRLVDTVLAKLNAPAEEPPYRRGLRAADEVVGTALAGWKRKAEIATEHEVKEEARTVSGVLAEIKDEINELFTADTKKE